MYVANSQINLFLNLYFIYLYVILIFFVFILKADERGKKEVAATVLIKTIKYYENTKYTLKKGKKKKNPHNCHVLKFFT
jgi:hypothetical protein